MNKDLHIAMIHSITQFNRKNIIKGIYQLLSAHCSLYCVGYNQIHMLRLTLAADVRSPGYLLLMEIITGRATDNSPRPAVAAPLLCVKTKSCLASLLLAYM